jgi:phage tail-like protein
MAEELPLVGFHFAVDIQGVIKGFFTECSGLGSEHEIIEHKIVTEQGQEVVKKIPGRLKWEDITLKRGITSSMDIWDWRADVENGNVEDARRDGSIIMFDQQLKEVARWNFERAWPLKVSGPSPKADSNEIGIEEMVITHEYIARVS